MIEILNWVDSLSPSIYLFLSQEPQYSSLDWRIECRTNSRSVRNTISPNVLTRWTTTDTRGQREHYLNCDVNTLAHITESLQQAQAELDSFHSRRLLRSLDKMW